MTGYVPLGFGYTLTKQLQAESTQLSALSTANTPPGGGQLFPVNSPIAAFRVHGPDSIIPTDVNTSDAGLLPDYSTNSAAPISSVGSSFMLNGSQVYGSYSSAELPGYSSIPSSVPAGGVYATSYKSSESSPHTNIEQAIFPSLSNTYSLKESDSSSKLATWTPVSLQPTAGFYRYDPTLAVYGYGAGFDLASRRKNATRESTATLKAWLNEHRKNPYPTKGEKIMLAIITKMTLTQVSTWFANSRRRLKKENKMTWEPKGRVEEDDDAIASAEELKREPKERASGCISSPVSTAIGTRMLEQDVVGVDPRNAIGVSVFKKQANGKNWWRALLDFWH